MVRERPPLPYLQEAELVLGRKVQTCVGTMDLTANKMFNSSRLYSARTSLLA